MKKPRINKTTAKFVGVGIVLMVAVHWITGSAVLGAYTVFVFCAIYLPFRAWYRKQQLNKYVDETLDLGDEDLQEQTV